MGERIGLDFGTTYTIVSRLAGDKPEAVNFSQDYTANNAVESIVVLLPKDDETPVETMDDAGEVLIGSDAVNHLCVSGARVFKGFKLLLGSEPLREEDSSKWQEPEEWKKRGYDSTFTPDFITGLFIEELFKKVKESVPGFGDIEKITVGIPNVWTKDLNDHRIQALHEIIVRVCQKLGYETEVDFCAEPKLAAGAVVETINRSRRAENESPFDGHILVIDYGGGTLDLALCRVENKDGKSVISVVGDGWGAGENTDGKVGKAGLAYMETLADIILEDNGIQNVDKGSQDYQFFVKSVEEAVKKSATELRNYCEAFDAYFKEGGTKYDREFTLTPMKQLFYGDKRLTVKHSALIRAYGTDGSGEGAISKVLTSVLDEAAKYMDENNIDSTSASSGAFKVVLVGGFCNFALTERHITKSCKAFRLVSQTRDPRYTEYDFRNAETRILSVANGAALEVNEKIKISDQFQYTFVGYNKQQTKPFVFFRMNEVYTPGKPVFYCNNREGIPTPVYGERIHYIQRCKNRLRSDIVEPAFEMDLPVNDIYLAIAMERDHSLTLYYYDYETYNRLSSAEKDDPDNPALIYKKRLPNIEALLGGITSMTEFGDDNIV